MNKIILIFTTLAILTSNLLAQSDKEFKPHGKVNGKIFTNFHSIFAGSEQRAGFEVNRAYFGYSYNISPQLAASVKLDIGAPGNDPASNQLNRFAYFKTAALFYKYGNVKVGFGMIDTYQFKVQEKFWARRYIAKSFMDEYSLGQSADLGTNVQYKIDKYSLDLGVYNGEGYKHLQTDSTFMGAFGITANPIDFLTIRLYGDWTTKKVTQSTFGIFTGLKFSKLHIAGEYCYKINNRFAENHDRFGYSIYGHYEVIQNWKIFGRYDKIESNTLDNEQEPWNLSNDGSAIWTGLEYSPLKNLNIAIDYQNWHSSAENGENESAFYMNIEVSF